MTPSGRGTRKRPCPGTPDRAAYQVQTGLCPTGRRAWLRAVARTWARRCRRVRRPWAGGHSRWGRPPAWAAARPAAGPASAEEPSAERPAAVAPSAGAVAGEAQPPWAEPERPSAEPERPWARVARPVRVRRAVPTPAASRQPPACVRPGGVATTRTRRPRQPRSPSRRRDHRLRGVRPACSEISRASSLSRVQCLDSTWRPEGSGLQNIVPEVQRAQSTTHSATQKPQHFSRALAPVGNLPQHYALPPRTALRECST